MLLPSTCASCGRAGPVVCAGCRRHLARPAPVPPPLGLDAWWAALGYDDVARALLLRCKNGQRRDLVGWLADEVVAEVPRPAGVVITWAPTGEDRRRRRGFDQAELLARAIARRWGLPCRSMLCRLPGPPQAGRAGADRRRNPAFRATGQAVASILLVDDVATTGSTLTAAARCLRGHGAVEVRAVVAAHAQRLSPSRT